MIVIALLTLDIHIPHAHSLKDKRMIVRSLKDRLPVDPTLKEAKCRADELTASKNNCGSS